MPRPAVCARIASLQRAIDALTVQAGYDGRGAYGCLGAMQRELGALETRLRMFDREPAVA